MYNYQPLLLLTLTLQIECASKWYTGENKPYDFGFSIEGNQHRRESKGKISSSFIDFLVPNNIFFVLTDSLGRIMGEYGFITADNVYHVTVYATDENGNFKIISMKNIKLHKNSDHDIYKNVPTTTTPQPFTVKTTTIGLTTTLLPTRGESCAHCQLPPKQETETVKFTTTTVSSINEDENSTIPPPFKIVSKDETTNRPQITTQQNQQQQKSVNEKITNQQQVQQNSRQSYNEKLNVNKFSSAQNPGRSNFNQQQTFQNLNNPLYRFDYATDFQGHKEEGDYAGNKNGEYYSIGRDNVKRIVSFKANEFGFMPQIRQQPLSLNELRQYDESNNKLRHYNFEWFYPNQNQQFFG